MQDSDYARIPLRRRDGTIRAYALVDAVDFEWLSQWRWCLGADGYAMRNEWLAGRARKQRTVLMHRAILGLEPGDPRQGDHVNRDRLDYRRENLRIAERAEKDNQQNVPANAGSSSQYRGVCWDKQHRKWKAQVQLDGRQHYLGYFPDEAEAGTVAASFRAEHMPFSAEAS